MTGPLTVWAWQADRGGCGFYRVELPLRALREYGGHRTSVMLQEQGFVEYAQMGNCGGRAMINLVQRIVLPGMIPAVRRLRRPPSKVVYEIDDDMFAIDPSNKDAFSLYSQPSVIDALVTAARYSDLVTVSTEPLAAVMEARTGVRTVVLPNCVDDAMFAITRPRRDRVRVGWAGGMGHDADMRSVIAPLRKFIDRHPFVDVHLIGHDFRDLVKRPGVLHTGWQNTIPGYWRSIDFDVGIAPLAFNVFNQSKSALKCLEYSALGIPTIASDAKPYREVIIDGVTGFLVTRPDQWVKRLHDLVNDRAMREEMGAAARAHIQAHHAMSRNWQRWEQVYADLCGATITTSDVPSERQEVAR